MRSLVLTLALFVVLPVALAASSTGGTAPGLTPQGGLSAPPAENPQALSAQDDAPPQETPPTAEEPVQQEEDPIDVGVPEGDLENESVPTPAPEAPSAGLPSTGLALLLLAGVGAVMLVGGFVTARGVR